MSWPHPVSLLKKSAQSVPFCRVGLPDALPRRAFTFQVFRVSLLVSALSIFVASAYAQADNLCAEATSLWIPLETSNENAVVKWVNSINYQIISGDRSAGIGQSIEKALRILAQESGLSIASEANADVDLMIGVVPDLSTAAPGLRKFVEGYFQELLEKIGKKGRVELEATGWDATFRQIQPKCSGISMKLNGATARAVMMVQQDETAPCVDVGLGVLSGLVNIRKYYAEHERRVPGDLIALALRTLYDKRVKVGMSRAEAGSKVGELCNGWN